MNKILIIGGSGFVGNAIYKELAPYYDVHATYLTDNPSFEKNKHFHQFDMEMEEVAPLLDQLKPSYIISALRGNVNGQLHLHHQMISWVMKNDSRILFLSSANVFDRFTNFPSYEYDKTFSESIYGRFKIKIENSLLRLPNNKYLICRVPMIFGAKSPRVQELKKQISNGEAIEVFPNVVINAAHIDKLAQQIHYLINRRRRGIFHLGSSDLIHHSDLIKGICKKITDQKIVFKNVFDSNEDRQLSVLPKEHILPKHLQLTIEEVIERTLI
ncbi:sugar nucleotide-binding protein [Nonlabens marinus]|uniref:RmlD-like substrate binding domain-containing protein n=1 Tax=Nonlabens marinus S1-08 TaxID=1454201 RepID=W8W0P4_9FLAO|nr:sugar nucleotide-binding protein [Nonlabens marinus]BAO56681.1 hypothetical protein NMS_2672 [Nonlabens marinus S1-08]